MGLAVGIDLGTTNSVAGLATPEGVRLAVDSRGRSIHASIVGLGDGVVVGNPAKILKAKQPATTIYSAKRLIGQNVRAPMVQLAIETLPFPVEEGDNQQPIIVVGGRRYSIPEISAMVLSHLKLLCEEQFGEEVTNAVITVPANFSDAQRQATKEAGRLAGLEVMRLVNEPTAAALAYGYGQSLDARVAIFDFGGGTFDVSVLKIDGDIFEVLATDGEFFLGGDDLDRVLAEHLAAEMNRSQGVDPRPIPAAMNRLVLAAEQIKHYLTEHTESGGTIDGIATNEKGRNLSLDFGLRRDEFDSMVEGYIDRTIDVCRNVLATADLHVRDIDDIILVGGSTRIPRVRERISEFFGREPATSINPDEVVAHGAAIQAAMLSGQVYRAPAGSKAKLADATHSISLRKEVPDGEAEAVATNSALLLDVTPESLRLATAGGYTDEFLEKNSPIPIERTREFTTAHDNQKRVEIHCCRGPHINFADNELLGSLFLEDLPDGRRGEVTIAVTFRVDPDGILHVRAIETQGGAEVAARLNVVGAPTQAGSQDARATVEPKAVKEDNRDAKRRAKEQAKQAKEEAKAEKRKAKEEAKRAKAEAKQKAKADKSTGGAG